MAKQEIMLQGLDGQVDELVLTTNGEATDVSLEDCARMLFPQEGEAVPRLRFKGFEEDWIEAKLGDLFTERIESNVNGEMLSVTMNNGVIKASENGRIDNSNSDKTHYKVVKVNDIAYNSMRMWQGASGCSAYEGIVSPAYTVVTPIEGIDPEFFACLFKTPSVIEKFRVNSQGLTSDTWNLKYPAFSKISILYPKDIEEQHLIASFFHRIDSQMAIYQQQFERLKQLRSACLESMFPHHDESKPQMRFNEFQDDWELVSFKDITRLSGVKNRENLPLESYSISNEHGFVPQNEQFEKGGTMSNADKRLYYIVSPDSFAYNPARINVGSIGYDDLDKDVIVSSLYVVFKTDEKTYNPFLNYWFKSPIFKKMIEQYQEGGVRLYFFYDKLCKCNFRRPSLEEQKRIATFLNDLDAQITSQQQRLEHLKRVKQACLNILFTNSIISTPPILRFEGFDCQWIRKNFLEIFVFIKNNSLSRAELDTTGTVMNIHYGDILIKFGDLVDMSNDEVPFIKNEAIAESLKSTCLLQDGDVVFADAAEDNIVGKCAELISLNDNYAVSGLHTIPCRPKVVFSEGFLGYCLNSPSFHDQLLPWIQGSKISSISKKALANTFINYPESLEEQRRIASFFRNLDKQINTQTQQIEKLKQMKKACLSQMIA